jgi:Holliday junction DNA helicase RuvA
LEKKLTEIQVDVNGIAYEISVPMSTLYKLPELGNELVLHTHFVVREDAQALYGFFEASEKLLFRTLIKVSGVGPKLALAILSGMAVDEFVRTVNANDVSSLVRMPGVGKKTAERLIIEMRDKLSEWDQAPAGTTFDGGSADGAAKFRKEAENALVTLGYKAAEANKVINQIVTDNPDVSDSETMIRLALKSMA